MVVTQLGNGFEAQPPGQCDKPTVLDTTPDVANRELLGDVEQEIVVGVPKLMI
jgi:hypothetical protein